MPDQTAASWGQFLAENPNPWARFLREQEVRPGPPYVLAEDAALLDRFAKELSGKYAFHAELLLLPYIGNPETAEVYLLTANPHFNPLDVGYHRDNPYYFEQRWRNLVFQSACPFFFFDDKLDAPAGGDYWRAKLKPYLRHGLDALGPKIMCVELSPYSSENFRALPMAVPSQEFSFALVRRAIALGKRVVVMRSGLHWARHLPELIDYEHHVLLTNPRGPVVARSQMRLKLVNSDLYEELHTLFGRLPEVMA